MQYNELEGTINCHEYLAHNGMISCCLWCSFGVCDNIYKNISLRIARPQSPEVLFHANHFDVNSVILLEYDPIENLIPYYHY